MHKLNKSRLKNVHRFLYNYHKPLNIKCLNEKSKNILKNGRMRRTNASHHKGCRQCGRHSQYSILLTKNYENIVYLDFFQHPEYKSVFDGGLDIDTICMTLSTLIPDANFVSGKTCLIFDEIQECPHARTALKFFKTDGRYDVIGTGSF